VQLGACDQLSKAFRLWWPSHCSCGFQLKKRKLHDIFGTVKQFIEENQPLQKPVLC